MLVLTGLLSLGKGGKVGNFCPRQATANNILSQGNTSFMLAAQPAIECRAGIECNQVCRLGSIGARLLTQGIGYQCQECFASHIEAFETLAFNLELFRGNGKFCDCSISVFGHIGLWRY